MSDLDRSAELIMKLYELRREEKMRAARDWIFTFFPESADDILKTIVDPETSAKYRMVTSYWDMAASFVNLGAINEEMFMASQGEAWVVFCKDQPYIAEFREMVNAPTALSHLETLLMRQPNAEEFLAERRAAMVRWKDRRVALEAGQKS